MKRLTLNLLASLLFIYILSSMLIWVEAYIRGLSFDPLLMIKAFKHYGIIHFPNKYLFSITMSMFATLLLAIGLRPVKHKYGSARYAGLFDVEKLGLATRGLLLGKAWGKFLYLDKPLSVLLIAPPGTGKTSGFVVPQVLTLNHSCVVHDPKGEIYHLTNATKKKQGYKVFLFNPISEDSCKFNIFDPQILPKEKGKLKSFVGNVAEILIRNPSKTSSSEFFYQKARIIFTIIANYIILTEEKPNLAKVRDKISDENSAANALNEIKNNIKSPEWLKKDCAIVLQEARSREQWAGIVGTLTNALDIVGFEEVVNATSGTSDITADILRNKKTIIYIKIDTADRKRLAPLVSLVFYSLGIQLTTNMPREEQYRVTFIIDEFPVLGKVDPLIELPAISRGYNLNIEFIAQDFDQITEIYGRETIGILQTNCAYKIILQQNNRNTAESFSRDIGNKTDNKTQTSSQGLIKTSTSNSEEGTPLITTQEIMYLDNKKFILLCQGFYHMPIMGDIPFYFQDNLLKKLVAS